jgi:hypothetical protein
MILRCSGALQSFAVLGFQRFQAASSIAAASALPNSGHIFASFRHHPAKLDPAVIWSA